MVGRITVAKSLLLSQLTHVISSLPDPSERLIKEINKILFTFVWNSKRNPLKRMRLCQPVQENGLEMVDFVCYVRSLKIKWIKRLLTGNRGSWLALTPSKLQSDFIWNFGSAALKKTSSKIDNPFWKDVVSAWICFSKDFKTPDELVYNENIFNSDHTKFKSSKYANWERKGVRVIGDLFDGNVLLTWEKFKGLYNISCNYLEYHGLLHSLPRAMQRDQPNGWYHNRPSISARVQLLLSTVSLTRILVSATTKNNASSKSDIVKIREKWMRDIGSFEPQSVLSVRNSICATRYTSFQFKFVMRILTTNSFLRLINYREDDRCTFCGEAPEALPHLFLSCRYVQSYWHDISRYVVMSGLGQICNEIKMFGDTRRKLITHIVTLAKYVIYNDRRTETRPSFSKFKAALKRDFEAERFIAAKQNNVQGFNKKWSPLVADLSA